MRNTPSLQPSLLPGINFTPSISTFSFWVSDAGGQGMRDSKLFVFATLPHLLLTAGSPQWAKMWVLPKRNPSSSQTAPAWVSSMGCSPSGRDSSGVSRKYEPAQTPLFMIAQVLPGTCFRTGSPHAHSLLCVYPWLNWGPLWAAEGQLLHCGLQPWSAGESLPWLLEQVCPLLLHWPWFYRAISLTFVFSIWFWAAVFLLKHFIPEVLPPLSMSWSVLGQCWHRLALALSPKVGPFLQITPL